ncbi:MAG: PAS domain S-box protein [Elusimicrobia bacterium]|nr:PAS domain S-box protein [Elusimicrobiota bacterium]
MSEPVNILILEDNSADAELMRRELRKAGLEFRAQVVPGKEAFADALESFVPGLVLADYSLPGFSGLAGLALARVRFPEVPVILVSGAIGEEVAIEALKAGATDYVLKQRLSRLGPVVYRALEEAKAAAEKKRVEEELRRSNDSLERAEEERRLTVDFLRLVNENSGLRGLARAATSFFQKQAGCAAVGVRLEEEGDYPYFEYRGFSGEFIEAENSLCGKDAGGGIVKDGSGRPAAACMCGNVICGRIDPTKPFFTGHGTFWTNSTSRLLAEAPKSGRPAFTRNRCNGEGYESVVLLPLRSGERTLGLLQFNDKRQGLFSPELIALWERLADQLAAALSKALAEEALASSEQRLRFHFENSPLAVVEWDSDFSVTRWSGKAEHIFGWKKEEVVGKRLPALNLVYPEDLPVVTRTVERLSGGKELVVVSSNRNLTKSGDVIECTWYNSVLLGKDGKMVCVMSLVEDITERSRAEEQREKLLSELKKRALELDTVFKTLPYIVSLHGPDGKYLRVNPALEELFGFDPTGTTREETSARLNARFPDGRRFTPGNMPSDRALNGETILDLEYLITDARGADHTLLFNAVPLKVGPHVYGAVFSQVEITERQKKEAELRKLNRVLKARSDSDQAMLYAVNERDYMNGICRVIVEDCGYPFVWIGFSEQDEARSVRPAAQAGFEDGYLEKLKLSWADSERGRGPTGTAIRTGKPAGCGDILNDPAFAPWREEALKRGFASSLVLPLTAGGQVFGALNIYSRLKGDFPREEVNLLAGLADDLSYGLRTIRLRAAARISEEDVQRIAHIGVWEHTFAAGTTTWSKEVYSILELDPEKSAASQEAFLAVVHPEDREAVSGGYKAAVTSRSGYENKYRLLLRDGRIKYINGRCDVFSGADGRPQRSVGIIHDVTARRKAEEELLGAQAELARAKRLSDIGTLAATVAHELRNPLATIGMAAVNIKRKAKNPELEKHLANIDKKVFESNQIINNLLFYSRLKPPHYERFYIHDIIEESLGFVAENLRKDYRIAVNREIDFLKGVAAEADPVQLKEVLNNLLNNAVDAVMQTGGAGGKIEVSGARKNGFIAITVRDSGPGMDKTTLEHVFDPFFTTKAKGTGLGLSVCRQIMDFHGGAVELKSEPGKGTVATVLLPVSRQGGTERERPSRS